MRKRYIYIGLTAFILLLTALSSEKDCYYRNFDYTNLNRYYANSLEADENSGYSGPLVSTPAISLPPGRYVVSVEYQTDTDQNMLLIKSEDETFGGVEEKLLSETSHMEVVLQLDKPEKGISVRLDYSGTGLFSVKHVTFRSDAPVCTDRFAIGAVALVFLAVWVWLDLKGSPERKTYLWILALGLISTLPFIHQYLIESHDIRFHLARIDEIKAGLTDGQFPVYLQPDAVRGYGYAAPLLYPQMFLYFPALLRMAGVSMVTSVGIFLLAVNLATAGIMYFCANRIFASRFTARMCSLFYTFAMYRIINQCTRFAVGELLAMVFLPLVVYGLYEVLLRDWKKWPWLTAGCWGVIQSHIISILFAIMLIVIFCLIFIRSFFQKQRFFAMLKAGIWTVLANLWFIVPFLEMMREELHTGYLQYQIETMSLSLVQIFQIFPLSQGDASFVDKSLKGVMPACLGISLIFFSGCCLYGLAVGEYEKEKKMTALCLILGALFTLITTQWFPWNLFFRLKPVKTLFSFVQFPWRFLTCATVFLSFCAGAGACWLRERYQNTLGVLALVLVLSVLPMGYYVDDVMRSDIHLLKGEVASCDVTTGNEYLYEKMDLGTLWARPPVPLSADDGFTVTTYEKHGTHMSLDYSLSGTEQAEIELAALYYPGYEILFQDMSEETEGAVSKLTGYAGFNYYLTVLVPPGAGRLMVRYRGTALWRGCFIVSLAALIVFYVVWQAEKKNIKVFNYLLTFRNRRHMHGSR